ncbi:MAG: Ig-like domain-containing protein [Lentisphaerae bacterium]|jgi:hypothetical protein|nr:Ig-like domain-containing protein [Lentisphaerota bacterium]MBT5607972.1 Ig-like domain-containing protein [Lentisphaerota bacterium]MBT7057499.1 Ig-like domain-containing protein [Lentisphaerota bacterium]MBT7845645.1 Ig-like domain-containing protein [Lentisphaerota bacterium]
MVRRRCSSQARTLDRPHAALTKSVSFLISVTRIASLALLVSAPLWASTQLSVGTYQIQAEGDGSVADVTVTVANSDNLSLLRVRVAFDPTVVEYVTSSAQGVEPRVSPLWFDAQLTEEDGEHSILTLTAFAFGGGTAVAAAPTGAPTFTFQLQAVADGVSTLTFPRNADPDLDQRADLTNSLADTVSTVAGQISVNPLPGVVSVDNDGASTPDGYYKEGDAIALLVQFDTAVEVTGTPALTLSTGGGANDAVAHYQSGSGTDTLTFAFTVAAGNNSSRLEYRDTGALTLNGGGIEATDSDVSRTLPAPGAAGSLSINASIVVDTSIPSVTLTTDQSSPSNDAQFEVVITFSEVVQEFVSGDIGVTNGAVVGLVEDALLSGRKWTATIDPTVDGDVTASIDAEVAHDLAGNTSTAATPLTVSFDRQAPTVTLTSTEPNPTPNQSFELTVTFSEVVEEFVLEYLFVVNGTAGNLQVVTPDETWTVDITATAEGDVTVDLDAGAVDDLAGNPSVAADQFSLEFSLDGVVSPQAAVDGPFGAVADVPVSIDVDPGTTVTELSFSIVVAPVGGAAALVDLASFTPAGGLPGLSLNNNTALPGTILLNWQAGSGLALSGAGTALGTVSVPIPGTAAEGETYTITVNVSSATDNGTTLDVVGREGTVTVSPAWYLVGDVVPGGGSESGGGFGDGVLDSADVRALRYWQFGIPAPGDPVPTNGTDRWDSSNAFSEDSPPTAGGDGAVNQSDIDLTFRRSLLPVSLFPRYERRRLLAGGRQSRDSPAPDETAPPADATLSIGDVEEEAGNVVSIPISLEAGSTVLTTLQFIASVVANGEATDVSAVSFVKDPGLAANPDFNDNATVPGAVLVGWAFDIGGGVTGSLVIGSLEVTVPVDGVFGDTWTVRIDRPSGTNAGTPVAMAGAAATIDVKPPALVIDLASPGTAQVVSMDEGTEQLCSIDVSGGVPPYTYVWTLNDVPIDGEESVSYTHAPGADVVVHPEGTVDQTLVCTVTDSYPVRASIDAEWSVTVQDVDREPGPPVISLAPTNPRTGEDGVLSVTTGAVDPDDDTVIDYAVTWTLRGSEPVVTVDGITLDSEHTMKGETWDVTAAAVTDPYGATGENVTSSQAASASVTIANTPPEGNTVPQVGVHKNTLSVIELTASDPDVDQGVDALTFTISTPPEHGALAEAERGPGTFTYTPIPGYTGTDSFAYQVDDGDALSGAVRVDIIVLDYLLRFDLSGASIAALELGIQQGTTPAFDIGWGSILPPPPSGSGEAVFLAPEGVEPALKRLQRDVRGGFAGRHWQIEASADASRDIVISWDPAELPGDVTLLAWQLTGRDGEVVPGSAFALSTATSLTVPAGATHYYGIGPEIAFEIETTPVAVPEGGTGTTRVRLTGVPTAPLGVAVAWSSGDTSLGVVPDEGDTLSFDDSNWDQWQSVTLSAAEDDDDTSSDSAVLTVAGTSGADPIADADFGATEQDDDVSVAFAVNGSGSTAPSTVTLVDTDDAPSLDLTATADTEWQFVNWTADGDAAFAQATASQTTVTPAENVVVTAHFTAALAVEDQTPASPASVDEGVEQTFSVIAGDGVPGYTYVWRLNGGDAILGAESASYTHTFDVDVVDHPAQSLAQTLVCTITDSAGEPATADAEWNITVNDVDQAAGVPAISLSTTAPLTGDDVMVSVDTDAVDPDADLIIDYLVIWTLRDSDPVVMVGGVTLGSGHTTKDDVWDVSVAAVTDPYDVNGPDATSANTAPASVTIGNTPPTAGDVGELVVQAGQSVTVQLFGADPDVGEGGDSLTYLVTAAPTKGQLGVIDQGTGEVVYQAGSAGGIDTFSYEVSDLAGSASPEADVSVFVYTDWLVEIAADAAAPGAVSFGVSEAATEAFDGDYDVDAEAGDAIAFIGDAGRLRRDMHGPSDTMGWEFEVTVADTSVHLSWDSTDVPDDGLTLCELAEPAGACIPGSRVDMLTTTELTLEPARPTTRYFAVLQRLNVDLDLQAGWNLISIPVEPVDPSVEAVFPLGSIHTDAVYAWLPGEQRYTTVTTVEPLVGYWVYCDAAVVVPVAGLPALGGTVELEPGWNLVGLPGDAVLIDNPAVFFPAWSWDAAVQVYGQLQPGDGVGNGQAFWIYAVNGTVLEFAR